MGRVGEVRSSIVLRAAAAQLGERNFHLASGSLGSKQVVDRPAELIRDELANDVHAIAGCICRYD